MALQGTIDSFAMADVLRLLGSSAKSGRLIVNGDRGTANLWLVAGQIVGGGSPTQLSDDIVDVVFDILRPAFVQGITEKFLRLLTEGAREARGLELRFNPQVPRRLEDWMRQKDNLLFGGRRVKSLLETHVERPLNRWLFPWASL